MPEKIIAQLEVCGASEPLPMTDVREFFVPDEI
jgi:hypothetical protein